MHIQVGRCPTIHLIEEITCNSPWCKGSNILTGVTFLATFLQINTHDLLIGIARKSIRVQYPLNNLPLFIHLYVNYWRWSHTSSLNIWGLIILILMTLNLYKICWLTKLLSLIFAHKKPSSILLKVSLIGSSNLHSNLKGPQSPCLCGSLAYTFK